MKTSVKLTIAVYLAVMMGCLVSFFVQQSIVYDDHIRPGRRGSKSPVAITLMDKQSGEIQEAELTFVNDSLVTNPLRMGNEIEEHLLSVMVANVATGMLLVFVLFTGSRKAPLTGSGES
jgi:hypothetical protein